MSLYFKNKFWEIYGEDTNYQLSSIVKLFAINVFELLINLRACNHLPSFLINLGMTTVTGCPSGNQYFLIFTPTNISQKSQPLKVVYLVAVLIKHQSILFTHYCSCNLQVLSLRDQNANTQFLHLSHMALPIGTMFCWISVKKIQLYLGKQNGVSIVGYRRSSLF